MDTAMEQNLDAYRTLFDLLTRFRSMLLKVLKDRHGEDWHRRPEFRPVVDRLVARKEREKAIDWYSSEYQQLIHYATFEDILGLLEADPGLDTPLRRLVAPPLLHARLLELEALREKLAMARAITDAEFGFLITFHQRFLDAAGNGREEEAGPEPAADPEAEPGPRPPAGPPLAVQEGSVPESDPSPPAPRQPADGPSPATSHTAPRPVAGTAAAPQPEPERRSGTTRPLGEALEDGDDRAVLRELYREVTRLADDLFTAEVPANPPVWSAVREHPWYEERFGKLGLRPLSDFYRLVSRVSELRTEGTTDEQIQSFLKEHNFARLLLDLRDMFQRNRI